MSSDIVKIKSNSESKMLVTHSIPTECLGLCRKNILSSEASFMGMAVLSAGMSLDPSTQVGVCYVDSNNKVLSTGFNSSPKGWDDNIFPWGKDKSLGEENTKYPYVVHAERNGILNYNGPISNFNNATAYVTLFPCPECAKAMIQIGVKRVVYLSNKYKDGKDALLSRTMFEYCGIECLSFEELNKDDVEELNISLMEVDKGVIIKKLNKE